ncbi:MAG: ATP synthase F1 subunit delta [Myxococcales bacterium]|nr:ATP synthase F1 subunit delta [Myxococcales bacterium]
MANVSLARRYARALIELSGQRADEVLEQLSGMVRLLEDNRELWSVATNPAFTREQRSGVMEGVMGLLGELDEPFANFLRLLVDRNRLAFLPDIARVYRDLADQQAGRVRGKVTSAAPLSLELLSKLERSLAQLTQREVLLEAAVDRGVLGGVAAQVGSVVYDGTLRTQLQDLGSKLQ